MVLPERIELSTSPLPRECSTTELRQQFARRASHGTDPAIQRAEYCHRAFQSARFQPMRTWTRYSAASASGAKRRPSACHVSTSASVSAAICASV